MRTRPRRNRGLTPVFSNILLILIIVLGMSFAFAFLTGYVTDFQLGQGSAIMELLEFEDVWVRNTDPDPDLDRIDITLYNYGKVAVKVLAVYLDGFSVPFTTGGSDPFLTLTTGGHGTLYLMPPQSIDSNIVYKIKVVTERGSAFEGQFTTPT